MKGGMIGGTKETQKKKARPLKKAPQAPKRFKSSYILFFIHAQDGIKKSLPKGQASAPQVSKKASEEWKAMSAEVRLHWDNEAAKEKQRYLAEKEVYTGPWQVPQKRAKKDPTAPKRNPSAFLLYSLTKRKELREKNPELKNTEISRKLGQLWRQTGDEEKKPFVDQEVQERLKYKERMAEWKEKKAGEDEIKKRQADERTRQFIAQRASEAEAVQKVHDAAAMHSDTSFKPVSDDFTHQGFRRFSPISHFGQQTDHFHFGHQPQHQQQGSWNNASEVHSNPNQMNSPYRPVHSNQQINSFDAFAPQQDVGFTEENSFYDQTNQRTIKIEGGRDSPYSYTPDEFDPVPIH